ncbi:uncharacterized protein PHALS_11680 [Plasmopara halstedii]|uniref:Uncharacterized protein n=1 Tax=Plasmopara halstedii TaxID=4781 RepID=A0A0P1AJB5_PLAHL|nr:uncharacterized protein PHALS_11680 [Plasmopara halstedii]CEG41328.1 hypothetical protein PHALS_11680 [Plasmopara halstedii]|eukprot:XP_024577697.1 hypothetical protein PHALS_11680 [Plasmopara halstedii]
MAGVRENFALLEVMEAFKNKVDKFNFLAKWITEVALGHPIGTLEARAIKISNLDTVTCITLVQLAQLVWYTSYNGEDIK